MVGSRFEPSPRLGHHYDQWPSDARQAAVLILLYPHADRWYIPFTIRPNHLPDHPGQICLPGGAIEPGEPSGQAAIREFHEEMGDPDLLIRLLGRLSTIYVRASNFCIDPWVGVADRQPLWSPSPVEVDQILEIPLDHLLDPATLGCHERHDRGERYEAPHFAWESHQIWGATCMIVGEFVTVVEETIMKANAKCKM
jgi:8-oxo-dGTP pyrophosphatase MutT (NUDIX family)